MAVNIIDIYEDDSELLFFENQYPLQHGMSYNSHILIGETKTAVLNSVDPHCTADWLNRIEQELPDGKTVDYLIVQHVEPDHGGGIEQLMRLYPEAKIVASAKALKMLADFHPWLKLEGRTEAVADGASLALGSGPDDTLVFIATPMVHWPEVNMVYHPGSKTLFSADAFGAFGAVNSFDIQPWPDEARRYYCNIVGKYGPQVKTALSKLDAYPVDTIKPLHGHDLHAPLDAYLNLYGLWSTYTPEEPEGVLIAYSTIYGATAKAARALAELLRNRGRKVYVADLNHSDISEAVAQAFRMGSLVCACATYDAGILPSMRDFLSRLAAKGLRNRRVGFIQNGSWAPVSAKVMRDMLEACKDMTFVDSTVTIHSTLHPADNSALAALAKNI